MSKAYFDKAEPDNKHKVVVRLVEAGPDVAVVEVWTNAESGELGRIGSSPAQMRYTMKAGTRNSGFTVVIED